MFKRIIFSALAFVAFAVSSAATLSPEQAWARVTDNAGRLKGIAIPAAGAPRLLGTTCGSDGLPAVYLFSRGQADGCMFVSADDVAAPLLGYCDSFSGGEMPPQLKWWLEQYAAEIGHSRLDAPVRYVGGNAAGADTDRKAIAPLLSTKWDQGAPYNDNCPAVTGSIVSNGKAPTGCVATAMAQIMKYFNWPAKGSGQGSATTSTGATLEMDLGVDFSWNDMIGSYTGSYSYTQAAAVALLMQACGYSVGMKYKPESSGAQSVAVPSALINNFGYDSGAAVYERDYYGRREWEDMIYKNLAEVGPVFYTGSSNLGAGHAFVCDGYSSGGYFHFNWGWGGSYDGYFLLTALNPEGSGIGGFAGGYNIGQEVILGIRKPTGEPAATAPFRLSLTTGVKGELDGNYLLLSGAWYNMSPGAQRFLVGARFEKVGATGANAVQYLNMGEQSLDRLAGWGGVTVPYTYASLTDGTYKVSLVTRQDGGQWLEALHAEANPDYTLLTRSGNSYTVADVSVSRFSISDVRLDTELYYEKAARISFRVSNESDVEVAGAVAPILLNGNSPVAEGECVFLDLMPGESVEQSMVFTLRYTSSFKTGTPYEFCLYNPCDDSVYGSIGKMPVKASPGAASLTCTSFDIDGGWVVSDKSDIRFTASVKCTSGYFADALMLVVFRDAGQSYVNEVQRSFNDYMFLSSGESAATTATLDFSQGVAGTYYLAAAYDPGQRSDPLNTCQFIISKDSGVEAAGSDSAPLTVFYNRSLSAAVITSGYDITSVSLNGIDGRQLAADVALNGTSATVGLSAFSGGIVVVTATDASGAVVTRKLAL